MSVVAADVCLTVRGTLRLGTLFLWIEFLVPLHGNPVPLDRCPVPQDGNPLPLDRSPVPLDGNRLPLDRSPVPLDGNTVPLGISPVPLDGTPVPLALFGVLCVLFFKECGSEIWEIPARFPSSCGMSCALLWTWV